MITWKEHLKSWRIESMMEIIKNKEEVKSVMNILQAFADGKTIQAIDPYDDEWVDQTGLNFKALFERQYRIKPEPKYRPFENAKECWAEMLKHQPFGVVKDKYFANYQTHRAFTCLVTNGCHFRGYEDETFESSFKNLLFADGNPFGVKVEE